MAIGVVKWFDRSKGFGFIVPDMGPRDVFVHASALNQPEDAALREGERVQFELVQLGDGRLAAQDVRRL